MRNVCSVEITVRGEEFHLGKCDLYDFEEMDPSEQATFDFDFDYQISLPGNKGAKSKFGKAMASSSFPLDCTYTIYWHPIRKQGITKSRKGQIVKYTAEVVLVKGSPYVNGSGMSPDWSYAKNYLYILVHKPG